MLFQSSHLRITAEHGTATLWLGFPGEPVNALDLNRLRELDAAIAAVEANPAVRILVIRSAKPGGFCAGVHPGALASLTTEADAGAFAWFGQRVMQRIADLEAITVAFIDGPCLGAGLELALACDYRLALAKIAAPLGFPDTTESLVPCFGGTVRLMGNVGRRVARELLETGRTISGREAKQFGLVDHSFCERRAKIEMRTFLDVLERWPCKPARHNEVGFAAERREFVRSLFRAQAQEAIAARRTASSKPQQVNPIPALPSVVGFVGHETVPLHLVEGLAMQGVRAIVYGSDGFILEHIVAAETHGYLTPLEAQQAHDRVEVAETIGELRDAGLVFTASDAVDDVAQVVGPRTLIAVENCTIDDFKNVPYPRRVIGVRFVNETDIEVHPFADTDADALATFITWLKSFNFNVIVAAKTIVTFPMRIAA